MKDLVLETSSSDEYDSDLPKEGCQKCLSDKIKSEVPSCQHDSDDSSSDENSSFEKTKPKSKLIKVRILLKEDFTGILFVF